MDTNLTATALVCSLNPLPIAHANSYTYSMQRKWDLLDETAQRQCIDEINTRIDELDGATPGTIAAQDIITIVTEHLAPQVYNRGVADAKKLIDIKHADLEIELDTLRQ